MHFSRMHTARLPILPRWGGGDVLTWSQVGEGVDVLTWSRGEVVDHWCCPPPPPPPPPFSDRMTNTCENITFARFATRALTSQKRQNARI